MTPPDAARRRAAKEALRNSPALHRSIVETAQEGIWLIDDTGGSLFANRSLARILGRSLEQIDALNVFDVVDPEVWAEARARIGNRLQAGHEVYEIRFLRGDGDRRWASVSASPLMISGEYAGSLLMISDVTDRKRTVAELERRALYDDLTGLPNRALLGDRLRQATTASAAGHVVGVFFVDLDDFKEVNDSYGHDAGDEVLRQVAGRLREVVTSEDTLARFASDEFVILAPRIADEIEADGRAQQVLDVIARPMTVGGHSLVLNASVGISLQQPPASGEQMVLDADVAMFQAKAQGRRRHVTFDATVARRSRHHLADVEELRLAIDEGQVEVHYQPQVDMRTGQTRSAEALARWRHPGRGLLPPHDFVRLAEASGLILPLGRQVLTQACADAASWAAALSRPVSVSVNVSTVQLDDVAFPQAVHDALAAAALPPDRLVLEITETAVMGDPERSLRVLHELQQQGVRLAIDDFGTGYSSLVHLKRLPVEEIKIDQEFVDGVDESGDDYSIVGAVISMGRALDLRVVAEGVETPAQAETLQRLGCTVAQGFLFGRPAPSADLLTSLQGT